MRRTLHHSSCSLQGGTLCLPPAQQVLPSHALLRCWLLSTACTLSYPPSRCYSFGPRFNVEMEVVLPGTMTVAESHDIALDLQHKVGWGLRGLVHKVFGDRNACRGGAGVPATHVWSSGSVTFFYRRLGG